MHAVAWSPSPRCCLGFGAFRVRPSLAVMTTCRVAPGSTRPNAPGCARRSRPSVVAQPSGPSKSPPSRPPSKPAAKPRWPPRQSASRKANASSRSIASAAMLPNGLLRRTILGSAGSSACSACASSTAPSPSPEAWSIIEYLAKTQGAGPRRAVIEYVLAVMLLGLPVAAVSYRATRRRRARYRDRSSDSANGGLGPLR